MTSHIVVPRQKVLDASGLSLRDAALIEPCAVGFHAVRRAEVAQGETVVVLGCGMIGLGALLGSLEAGARAVVVDLSHQKLEVAGRLGAHALVNPADGDVIEQIRAILPEGPDVVIEAVGAPATFRQAVDIVGQCGRVVYIGYAKDEVAYDTKRFITKEIDVRGSRNAMPEDFAQVIACLKANPSAGDQIVSAIVSLAEAPEALARWDRQPGDFIKILVQLDGAA